MIAIYIIVAYFLIFGLLPEVIPGTQYWEARRRHDYNKKFGQLGRWECDDHARDHYTAMRRKKNPLWRSKFPDLNRRWMFDICDNRGGKFD